MHQIVVGTGKRFACQTTKRRDLLHLGAALKKKSIWNKSDICGVPALEFQRFIFFLILELTSLLEDDVYSCLKLLF